MALNWDDLQRVKRIEARANALGFEFKSSDHSWIDSSNAIYVKPKDDLLPLYSRDATFFKGTLESIENWLDGIEWARRYDELLRLTNDKKRAAKEQQERNKQLMKTIETGVLVQGTVDGTAQVDPDWVITLNEVDSAMDYANYASDIYNNTFGGGGVTI